MAVIDLRDGMDPLVELSSQLVEARRSDVAKPFGIYFVPGDDPFSALARFVERTVFQQWFANDEATMETEYGPFEAASDFILCVDHEQMQPAGTFRVLRPNPQGLKTLIDVAAEPGWGAGEEEFLAYHKPRDGMARIFDAATLAVRPEWTGSAGAQVSHALYAGLYTWCMAHDADMLVSAIDTAVVELLLGLGVPVEPLCGLPAKEYLGSPSTLPIVLDGELLRQRMRDDPELRSLLLGEGVSSWVSLPVIDLRGEQVDLRADLYTRAHTDPLMGRAASQP